MWRILQQDDPEDYVVANSETHTLEEFVVEAFNCVGLDWSDHVVTDPTLLRPSEMGKSCQGSAKEGVGRRVTRCGML